MVPSTQKAFFRPIAFVLDNGLTGQVVSVPLYIRPEDLTKTDPSRLTTQQTLGNSAFVDNFGPGLSTIVISGHTGWRGNLTSDGVNLFLQLKQTVFDGWHSARADAVAQGQDPDQVKLVFADTLNQYAVVVTPNSFILKRSRSRPLLMMYQITMTVIDNLDDSEAGDSSDDSGGDGLPLDGDTTAGEDSLNYTMDFLGGVVGDLSGFIPTDLLAPVTDLINTTTGALSRLLPALQGGNTIFAGTSADLLSLASDLSIAGRNAMYSVSAIATPADYQGQYNLSATASALDNAVCVLNNVYGGRAAFPDFTDVYGASNCSSTAGGSPISPLLGSNAFESISPQPSPTIAVTRDAQSAIDTLKVTDSALLPATSDELSALLNMIKNGVTFP